MPTELLTGLVLAAVTGLVWVAYNHPQGFKRIYWALLAIQLVVIVAINSYSLGLNRGFAAMSPFLQNDKLDNAYQIVRTLQPDGLLILFGSILSAVFLSILYFLPEILGQKRR